MNEYRDLDKFAIEVAMLEKLSYNPGRKDEVPNIELTAELCSMKDRKGQRNNRR